MALCTALPSLEALHIPKCGAVTAVALQHAVGALGLGLLDVTNCTGIAMGEIEAARETAREAGRQLLIRTSDAVSVDGVPLAHSRIRPTP